MYSVNDADLAAYVPSEGGNLLNLVCSSRSKANLQLARILIERGVAIDARTTTDGSTPLISAARNAKLDHMQLLLEQGADVEAVDKSRYNVLQVLAAEGHFLVLKELVTYLKGALPSGVPVSREFKTRVFGPVREEDCELIHLSCPSAQTVQYLLEAMPSLNTNTTTRDGNTTLHLAALIGAKDSVKLLIDRGADVEALNGRQRTPLHEAAISGSVKIVKMLCENGAKIDAVMKTGRTPLHYAAHYGWIEVAKYLFQAGASTTMRWQGLTPEILAISRNWPDIASLLRRHSEAIESTSSLCSFLWHDSFQILWILTEI